MNLGHIESAIKCPYFVAIKTINKHYNIVCECSLKCGTEAIQMFNGNADFYKQIHSRCSGDWESCPQAKAVSEKYI